jgi:hypothetical protein
VALSVTLVTLFVAFGGLLLFYARRNSRLLARREWWTPAVCVFYTVLSLQTAYREGLGEPNAPCAAFYAVNYPLAALVAPVLLARFLGLYARHVKQIALLGAVIPGRGEATSWHASLDSFLMRHRMDSSSQLQKCVLLSLLPWLVFYIVRLSISSVYRNGSVGCRFDVYDTLFVVVEGIAAVAVGLPVLMRLRHLPDTLLLRFEILFQIVCWPFMLAFFLYGTVVFGFDLYVINTGYAVVGGNIGTLLSSVWVPALLSFAPSMQDAPDSLQLQQDDGSSSPLAQAEESSLGSARTVSAPTLAMTVSPAASISSKRSWASFAGFRPRPRVLSDAGTLAPDDSPTLMAFSRRPRLTMSTSSDVGTLTPAGGASPILTPRLHRASVTSSVHSDYSDRVGTSRESTESSVFSEHLTSGVAATMEGAAASAAAAARSKFTVWSSEADFRLVTPPISSAEVEKVLKEQSVNETLTSSRSLNVLGGLLVSTQAGRTILTDLLVREFNAELLAFLVATNEVHKAVAAVLESGSPEGRAVVQEASIAITLDDVDDIAGNERSAAWSELAKRVSTLLSRFIVPGAPGQVNLSPKQVGGLCSAARQLSAGRVVVAFRRAGSLSKEACDALSALGVAVRVAEKEIFRLIVSGPVYRLVRNSALFSKCCEVLLREMAKRDVVDLAVAAAALRP